MSDDRQPGSDIRALPIFAMVLGALTLGAGAFDVFIAGHAGPRGVAMMAGGAAVALTGIYANQRR